jgi:hypothetical protein
MIEIVNKILVKLDKNYNDVIKKKHGKCSELLFGDFLLAIIEYNSAKESRIKLNISEQTFNRTIKKVFPDILLQGGGLTWSYYILSLIEYKKCFKCSTIQSLNNFHKGRKECSNCRILPQKIFYDNNKEIWDNYYINNYSDYLSRNAQRRGRVKQATPKWAELDLIKEFYKNCPEGYHVDHIIPLKGINVSGLHTLNNLQYLPAKDNMKKSNRLLNEC